MADDLERRTLSEGAARQLANATKNNAQWGGITPRWLLSLESSEGAGRRAIEVECSPPRDSNPDLPETFVDYVDNPREYFLKAVTTVLDVQTRVSERRRRTRPERGICRALLQRQRASRPAPPRPLSPRSSPMDALRRGPSTRPRSATIFRSRRKRFMAAG